MEINWEILMYVVLAVGSAIWTARQPIVEGVAHRIFDALWGFVSRGLGRLWRLIAALVLLDQGQAVVDLQKIEEELKTQIKGVEAENEVLKEKNGAMEKQVVDLQKMEEVFKTKVKEVEAENEMLSKRNEKVVHLQKREEELKEEIKELKTESKELKLESKEVKKEIKEVEAEKEVMRKRNEVTEKKVGDLQKIEEELKIEIKELKTELRELKKEIKEVEAKNEVLRNRNEVMEKKVADLQRMEEEPKTKIKGEEAENKVLIREKSEAMEIMSKIIGEGGIPKGPWGGNVGAYWAYKSDIAPIMQITLRYGSVIDSISIKSKSCEGNVIGSSQRFGGPYGHNSVTFRIDSSIEQLSSISLTYGHFNGERTITSLCFYSNRDTYGPFGSVQDLDDPPVSIPIEDDVVLAGFHGRAGNYLNAIGILVAPKVLNS